MQVRLPRVSPRALAALARWMQVALAGVVLVGLHARNPSVVLNGVVALGVTFLPAVLERDYRIPLPAWLTLWLTTAVLLHAVGLLGPYRDVWWWDHVTHTLSAALVAGAGYATVHALDVHSEALYLPSRFLAGFVLLFTLALGVGWEVLEFAARAVAEAYGYGPVLVQYGLEDTIVDLLFDLLGALVVAVFGSASLGDLVDAVLGRLRRAGD